MSQPYAHRAEIERLDQRPGSTSDPARARGGCADGHERWAVEALKTGVRGILPKSATVENLLKAVRVVHQGQVWATVKAHLTRIFQKLALRGRAQLAARYHAAFPAPSQGAGGAQPVEHRWKPDPVGARTGRAAGP